VAARTVAGATAPLLGMSARSARLATRCARDPETRHAPVRHFLRHLPFLRLASDVVHFEFTGLATMYPLVPELLGAPSVVSCRGSELNLLAERPPSEVETFRQALLRASAIHCVSQDMAAKVSSSVGRTAGVHVNRPAVPVESIAARTVYAHDRPPTIVAVGRLVWIKGFDHLLAALARLKRSGVAFRARIIGDGPLFSPLRYSIADLGLAPEVTLTGPLAPEAVLAELAAADVYALTSHEEGISNGALEAMAAGLPVVTTRAGGMAEVVRDGREGFVVHTRDLEALAARLGELLGDAALRERMGRAARRRAEQELSLERQATIFEQLYRSVAGKA
jgi:glycosyltransferase involved in cell wall biosynthesis